MKKLFLSLMLAGFCSEIISSNFQYNPNAINCLLEYPNNQHRHCKHPQNIIFNNKNLLEIQFNIQKIIGEQQYFSDHDIVLIKIPNMNDNQDLRNH